MLRTECAGCGHSGLTVFADLGSTPLADVFPTVQDPVDERRFLLRAATCDKCGLAQLLDVVDDRLLYGPHYGFRTGGSPSSLPYMAELAKDAVARGPGHGMIIEIGCNDGTLMGELIHAYGGRDVVMGVDPSAPEEVPNSAMYWQRVPFTAEWAHGYAGHAGLVVAVNVAAHVTDPHDFLKGIAALLADDGVAVVEFQYLPDLLAGCMFDLIYHEHRFFYTLGSFSRLASQHGLHIRSARHTMAQGGSLRVTLDMRSSDRGGHLVDRERKALPGLLAGFQQRAEYARDRIRDVVQGHPGTVYGYAASAKSCTLLNFCRLGPGPLPYVVDATPSKWGRFTPGSGIPIIAPPTATDPCPDAYLLLASNYLSGVLRREQEAGYKGEFIVPLPLPVIV